MGIRAAATIALITVTTPTPGAADTLAPAQMVVDFQPTNGAPEWLARALEGHAVRELVGFGRVAVVDRGDVPVNCPERTRACVLGSYREHGIDLVLLGSVLADGIDLSAHETWTPRTLAQGVLTFDESRTLPQTRHRLITMLSPIFSSGGWLDERPMLMKIRTPEPPDLPTKKAVRLVALLLIALFALPALVSAGWIRRGAIQSHRRPAGWVPAAVAIGGAALTFGATLGDLPGLLDAILASPAAGRAAAVIGGFAWGAFALANFRILVPKVLGLERADHHALGPLLSSWLVATGIRVLPLALLYSPFVLLLWGWIGTESLAGNSAAFVLIPLGGLLILGWASVMLDTASVILDSLLVRGAPSPDNKWHKTATRYFRGYIKRGGLAIPSALQEELLILPTDRPLPTTYGGGLTHPRILVPLDLLELALGEAPEEEDAPSRRYFEVRHWLRGTLIPNIGTPPAAVSGTASAVGAEVLGHPQQDRILGENATLLGLVTPSAAGDPSFADDRAVRELLAAHYASFLPLEWNEEQDDTDPNQRDLLFGALLCEVGSILRKDTVWQTVSLLVEELVIRAPGTLRTAYINLVQAISPLGARSVRLIKDAYPALNSGRDALIQYLYFRMTRDTELLTARADSYRFASSSREIMRRIARVDLDQLPPIARVFQRRLIDLNLYLRAAVDVPVRRWPRRIIGGAIAAALLAIVVFSITDAARYAPVFEERMKQLNAQKGSREGKDGGTD